MTTATAFIPFELYSGTKISIEALEECLKQWCADKPGTSFEMVKDGAWLEAPPEYLGNSLDVFTAPSEVSISFKVGV